MPGVRVRVSSRGVRTSIGPRIARVHVGGGRTGFSTGLGPISYSTSLGGSKRYSGSGSYARSYGPTPTQVNKHNEAQQIEARLKELLEAHKVRFQPATRQIVALGSVPDLDRIYKVIFARDVSGIGFFKFKERKQIKAQALEKARLRQARLKALEQVRRLLAQKICDEEWTKLVENDPETLMQVLTEAFGDNEAKSAVLEVDGDSISVIVVAPELEVLPDRDWSYTAAGNLSVKRMTAKSRDYYYFDLIFSQLVATLNEAFAVAPGIQKIKLVLVRNKVHPKLGGVELECLGFGTAERRLLHKFLREPTPFSILNGAVQGWENKIDANLKMKPVKLADEPDIRALLAEVTQI